MKRLFLIPVLLMLCACSAGSDISPAQDLVTEFVGAYNAQDASAMTAMAHEDIDWIYISGSEAAVATKGKEAMAKELEGHFSGPGKVSSQLSGWSVNGNFLSVIETVSWTGKDGAAKQQASIAVYEMDGGLIRRVWYFPEQK